SGACEFCAKLLKKYLAEQGIKAEVHRITGLGRSFDEGLYNLLDQVSTLVKLHKTEEKRIYLNATGGFKPETAVLYTAACILDADRVYYIHEAMKDVVEVPALSLTIDPQYVDVVKKLKADVPIPEKVLKELEVKGLIIQYGKEYRLRRWVELLLRLKSI
ncbi:MAG: putative CRISPR-associated protein, partial [Thermofilaceae archaeon]